MLVQANVNSLLNHAANVMRGEASRMAMFKFSLLLQKIHKALNVVMYTEQKHNYLLCPSG